MTGNLMFKSGIRYIGTEDANNLVLRTNNADRIILASAGNVGIGVTPTSKLHVNGQVDVSSNKIVNVAMPAANLDAANKKYVDDAISNAIDVSCSSDCTTGPVGSICADGAVYVGVYQGITPAVRLYARQAPMAGGNWSRPNVCLGINNNFDGLTNTNTTLANCHTPPTKTAPAVAACRDLGASWYLPSLEELKFLYEREQFVPDLYLSRNTGNEVYWTSTEAGNNNLAITGGRSASTSQFTSGSGYKTTGSLLVHCVRR